MTYLLVEVLHNRIARILGVFTEQTAAFAAGNQYISSSYRPALVSANTDILETPVNELVPSQRRYRTTADGAAGNSAWQQI